MVETRNLDQYAIIHQTRGYGRGSAKIRRWIQPWVQQIKPESLLDYGAGQSNTANELKCASLKIRDRYDPAIPTINTIPRARYDLVTCTDVLEHLDEPEIIAVLNHIKTLSPKAIIASDTRPASTILPNGENAHATVKSPDWWRSTIASVFGTAELIHVTGTSAVFRTWEASAVQRFKASLTRLISQVFDRDCK